MKTTIIIIIILGFLSAWFLWAGWFINNNISRIMVSLYSLPAEKIRLHIKQAGNWYKILGIIFTTLLLIEIFL